MSEQELIKRLKELKEEGAILGKDEVRTILNLIEKQDKMIDLMAERIYRCENYNPYLEWCPNWKRILRESAEEIKEKYRKKVKK